MKHSLRLLAFLGVLVLLIGMPARAQGGQHTMTVTFNFDFTTDNGCSATVTTNCVKQFNVYDITTGTPVKLFSVPAPSGANAAVTGITATSIPITLRSGAHIFAATTMMADSTESSPNASTATASALPGSPATFSIKVN